MGNDKRTYYTFSRALRFGALVLAFLVLRYHPLSAQEKLLPVFKFNRLTTANGLPTNEIRSNVVRDRQGFIWFGTENGLVRYDGYTCKVYRTFKTPSDALVLYFDTKGRFWIGTYGSGLSLYDPLNDRFVNFLPRQDDSSWLQARHIYSIHEDGSGAIWLGSGDPRVVRLDLGAARNETNADSVAAHVRFHNITYAGFGDAALEVDMWDGANVLVATAAGLFLIDRETCRISRPGLPPVPGLSLDTVFIMSLFWGNPTETVDRHSLTWSVFV